MPYAVVKDFKGGLDTRRDVLVSVPGTLSTLNNAHITRGGDIEKRKAFEVDKTLPSGTFGYEVAGGAHYVFGSATEPVGIPSGVTYQRLQHPDALTMTSMVCSTVFNGKVFAVAEYTGGVRMAFYDGTAIDDFYSGLVRSAHSNLDDVAEELSDLIDAHSDYSGNDSGSEIYVLGPEGQAFTVTATATDGGGTDDQTIEVTTEVEADAGVTAVEATGELEVSGGAGTTIDRVKVGNVTIFNGTVNWTGSDANTAALLAEEINDYTPTTGEVSDINVTAMGTYATAPTGVTIEAPTSGTTATAHLTTQAFSFHKTLHYRVSDIIVDNAGSGYDQVPDVTITGGTHHYLYSETGATAVAAIEDGSGEPTQYSATAVGNRVIITAADGTGTTANTLAVTAEVNSTGTQDDSPNICLTTIHDMEGGVDGAPAIAQQSYIKLGGTKENNDVFAITLTNSTTGVSKKFSGKRTAGISPSLAKTFDQKVYLATADGVYFPKVNDPTEWEDDDLGSGLIAVTNHSSGSEEVKAIGVYGNNLAFFSENNVQVWFIDPDPDQNYQTQILDNVGSFAPLGVQSIGDIDVLFPSYSGIRSLRARDSSNSATVSDIGTPIDELITEAIAGASASTREAACSVVDPIDGRYWLYLDGTIYVLSWFRGSNIAAWSTYTPEYDSSGMTTVGTIEKFGILNNRIYFRAGDKIFNYGGSSNDSYDESVVTVELPYLDTNKPAHKKQFTGIDLACSGLWQLNYNINPEDNDEWDLIGNFNGSTYHKDTQGFHTYASHLRLKATTSAESQAKLSNLAIHFKTDDAS